MASNKKVFSNTILLYARMLFVTIIGLYTVRIVLNALGEEDYGIYNVVAGVVTMLQCVTNVISTATQRYFSIAIGKDNKSKLSDIFSASFVLFIIFSFIFLIIFETIGLWFVNSQLMIPDNRIMSANFVYQFAIFSFIFTMLQIPYLAASLAHENMKFFTVISTVESLFKLLFAILLSHVTFDKLSFYGAYLCVIPLIALLAYIISCRRNYPECHCKKVCDKKIYKELTSFSGWTLFGSISGVGMNQVVTILINVFFGPIVNASRAISTQVYSLLNNFSGNFIMAIRPSMIRAYAEGDREQLVKQFGMANKFIFYSLLLISLPVFMDMENVLNLWLKQCSVNTVLFTRLILIYTIIISLNNPITILVQATGKIKYYHIFVESFTLLCPVVTYIMYKIGFPAYTTFIVMILSAVLAHIVRLIYIKKILPVISINDYIKSFCIPALIVMILAATPVYFIEDMVNDGIMGLILITIVSSLSLLIFTWFLGFSKSERVKLLDFISTIMKK